MEHLGLLYSTAASSLYSRTLLRLRRYRVEEYAMRLTMSGGMSKNDLLHFSIMNS